MPLQYMLVSEAHRRIARAGRPSMGMPVGQIVGSMTDVRPVREVIYQLIEEYAAPWSACRITEAEMFATANGRKGYGRKIIHIRR